MEFREFRLENGLEIVAECNPAAYSVALAFVVKTGARHEPESLAGVSHFLEHMAFKGTGSRTADEVNRAFDEIGAYHNAFTAEEITAYHAVVLPEYWPRALELLADLLRPALRADDFELERQVVLEEIQMYEDQPPFGADDKCRAAFFGSHPLGHSVLGTSESIEQLTADQMRAYFHQQYAPGNTVLVAAGRVDFDRLVELAAAYCGRWEPREISCHLQPATGTEQFLAMHKPGATQQYVVHLTLAPQATSEDRFAADLLATVVGDDSGSRLFWELVDPGLAEQASLSRLEHQEAGLFATFLASPPEQAVQNLQRTMELYRKVEQEGVTPEELERAKRKMASRMVLAGEKPRNRVFAVGGDWILRRQYTTVEQLVEQIESVTCDDVARVLAQYPLSRGTTVAIGPLAPADWSPVS